VDAPKADQTLDARGMACPMPILKARQELGKLAPGQVLKVIATDRGSVKDFQGWAQTSKQLALVAQSTEQENGKEIYVHFLEKKA
jgi:tRNA 2-thiouridine synthesizing protein A